MDNILDGLNKEQLAAVTYGQGPLLIIAGAGTGKTTVISRRIAWLLSSGLAKTNEILALTFTDKAALEMLSRVDLLVPYGYTDIWISTFHAFGDRLLRENALVAGLDPDFKILTRPDAAVFFREHLFEFDLNYYRPLSDPRRFIESLISVFCRARDEDISAQEYLNYAQELSLKAKENPQERAQAEEALREMEIASAYARYLELLAKYGGVDFANQFYLALKLLREHPLVLRRYEEQFKYILVDEFQDTNFAQFQMVKLLAEKRKNVTVVADDDQCIYRWRGAAYSNVLNFMDTFKDSEKISLIRNYRSGQAILDCAYKLIQNNNPERFEVKAGIDKKLVASSAEGRSPVYRQFRNNSGESDWVAQTIKDKVRDGNFVYKDFAILVRSNSDAQPYLQALNMQGIPWQFSGNQGLYLRQEVKLCISFLRVVADCADSLSLYYLVSSEVYGFPLEDLSACMHYSKRRNTPLYLVFKNLESIPDLAQVSGLARQKLSTILADLEKFLKFSRQETTGRLLYSFLTETGYLKKLTQNINLENEAKIQNIAKFFSIVRDFELVAKEDRVINYVNYLDLLIEAGDDPETAEQDLDSDMVNVLTIHKAKGLEFRVVFLVTLVDGRFPVTRRRQPLELPDKLIKEILPEGDFHLQEERRLFYVGMTRAKEELYFTSAVDYGGLRLRRVSQFVIEALGEKVKGEQRKKTSALETIQRFAPGKDAVKKRSAEISEGGILNLSFYKIDDYLSCPLKYQYVHTLRVPIMEHHTIIYGRAMHDAVTKYFQSKMAKKEWQLADLLNAFKESFDPQGFLSQRHQEARFKIGQEALVRFYAKEQERNSSPLYIEKSFSFIFENNKIAGRFDRIDLEKDEAVIMDFKTSELNKQSDADKRAKESLQLAIYALAYKQIFGKLPVRVELYFLESGLIGSAHKQERDLDKVKDKIREAASGIRKRIFNATPQYMSCTYCAYNQICQSAMIR